MCSLHLPLDPKSPTETVHIPSVRGVPLKAQIDKMSSIPNFLIPLFWPSSSSSS